MLNRLLPSIKSGLGALAVLTGLILAFTLIVSIVANGEFMLLLPVVVQVVAQTILIMIAILIPVGILAALLFRDPTSLIKFVLKRLIQAIPTLFGITLLSYMIVVFAPGDPVSILTFDPNMNPKQREVLAQKFGVNDPVPVQYIKWLLGDDWVVVASDTETGEQELGERRGILRGDFGDSFVKRNRDVLELIVSYLPATIELNIVVLIVGLSFGIIIGFFAAIMRGRFFDNATRILAVIGDAIPNFWLGFILLLVFSFGVSINLDFLRGIGLGGVVDALDSVKINILPSGGQCPPTRDLGCPPIWQRWHYLVLPATVLVLGVVAGWSRLMRASMLDNINSEYVRTAKAKGLVPTRIWFTHAARNAMIPAATFLGPAFVSLLGGAVVIEQIFSWPGIGRFFLQSLSSQDYPVVMASVVISGVLTIAGYILSDIMYAVFDPRIRF